MSKESECAPAALRRMHKLTKLVANTLANEHPIKAMIKFEKAAAFGF